MEPNKVLILGHSIVRRFQQFLTSDADVRYCEDLGLRENHRIFYRGVGGRTISGILREDASFIEKVKPHNIILIVGGNDVRRATSPEELAANLESLVSVLHYRFGVSRIHVCKLLPRFKQCFDYNSTVDQVNILLKSALHRFEFASFWEHNDLFPSPKFKACDHKFLFDGVHLNKQGNVHLYRSLRGLILSRMR